MKNPLVTFGILGILVGFLFGRLVGGPNQNNYLTYGMIGGLAIGFLLDARNRQSGTKRPYDGSNTSSGRTTPRDIIDVFERPSSSQPSQPVNSPQEAQTPAADEGGRSRVSRVDESASDVIARAREEIEKNTPK